MRVVGISRYLNELNDADLALALEEIDNINGKSILTGKMVKKIKQYIDEFAGRDLGLEQTITLIYKEASDRFLNKVTVKESECNDVVTFTCTCPSCKIRMQRGLYSYTTFCSNCGQKIHISAFSEEDIAAGKLEREGWKGDYND